MSPRSDQEETVRAQGVPFLIIAAIVITIALFLLLSDLNFLIITAIFAFGLFLVGCGVQSFIRAPFLNERGRIFGARRLAFLLGLIPLAYAMVVAFIFAQNKVRAFMVFFALFVALIISYLWDIYRPKKAATSERIAKFYGKAAEAHEALGVEDLPNFESVQTRSVPFAQRWRLLRGMLKFAPWQLIASFILAISLMVVMHFVE